MSPSKIERLRDAGFVHSGTFRGPSFEGEPPEAAGVYAFVIADEVMYTRLTNAFSKKFENHMHMVALYTVWYNFVKQHKTLRGISPSDGRWIERDFMGYDQSCGNGGRGCAEDG